MQMLHTHTHTRPEPGQPWKARGRKKRTHEGQTAETAQGGRGTDGPQEPTYTEKRTWPKTAHTPKPHDTLRRGTRGKLGTEWGTSWWQKRKPKQLVKQQDSVPKPRSRALCHSRPVVSSCPNRHITASKFQRIRCTTCFTSPDNHQKEKDHTWKACTCLVQMSWHDAVSLWHCCKKRWFLNVQHGFTVTEVYSTRFHKGPQDQRDTQKAVQNGKAICCTLLKRITKLKCVNSEVKSVRHLPHNGGSLNWVHGTMSEPPWKSH